jgi:hypothetical protein
MSSPSTPSLPQGGNAPTQMVLDLLDLGATVDGTITKPTLKDKSLNSAFDATTAQECWDKLASFYEGKGGERIVHRIDEETNVENCTMM